MKIAVIGCGSIGLRHLANLQALGERDPIVYDNHSGQLANASAEYDVPLAPSLDYLWDQRPEVALICTPPDSHVDLLGKAWANGVKAVFCEKPLADKIDAKLLCGIATGRDITTMVGCNYRYMRGIDKLRGWLQGGALGALQSARVVHKSWLPSWHSGHDYHKSYTAKTGVLLDVGPHAVDLLTYLCGDARLLASAVRPADALGLECDGSADLLLKHDSGLISTVQVSFCSPFYSASVMVEGTAAIGMWAWDGVRAELTRYHAVDRSCETETWPEDGSAMYIAEMQAFLRCCREGSPSPNPMGAALRTMEILCKAKGDHQYGLAG